MSQLARVVFALLVAATFGAFFVAQRLKSAESVAEYTKVKRFFSPNGDGRRDVARITFKVKEADELTATIVNRDGDRVRRLATDLNARPDHTVTVVWDGKTDSGARAPDGLYRMQLGLRRTGRTVTVAGSFVVDTTAPTPVVLSVDAADRRPRPRQLRDPRPRRRAPPRAALPRPAHRRRPRQGGRALQGHARAAAAASGTAASPARPRRRGSTWSSSASATARATSGRRPPCSRRCPARSAASPASPSARSPRSRRWSRSAPASGCSSSSTRGAAPTAGPSAAIGASRPIKKGRGAPGKTLSLRAPRGISGAYLLQIRSGRSRASVPFLVQAQDRAKLLVVTPTLSWLGVDKVDDDSDGLPNTLETGGPVEWPRVINGAQGIPPAFAAETAPLLVFLDRARIRYDLTSDIALARSRDPRATDREGVILAGSLRWVSRPLARRLRRYVDAGGRLASFGTESLRRGVRIGEPPAHAADPADADRPVRRPARAGGEPAHRGRRPHAAAADRARRGAQRSAC